MLRKKLLTPFFGDISRNSQARERVVFWGDLLKRIITEGHSARREYMTQLIQRFYEAIANEKTDLHTSTHLALVLMDALSRIRSIKINNSPRDLWKYKQMNFILEALLPRWDGSGFIIPQEKLEGLFARFNRFNIL